jgi:hypothetical protein
VRIPPVIRPTTGLRIVSELAVDFAGIGEVQGKAAGQLGLDPASEGEAIAVDGLALDREKISSAGSETSGNGTRGAAKRGSNGVSALTLPAQWGP